MPLMTYKETRPFAKAMKEAVALKKMPPWFADQSHGKFANERRLTAAEIETIANWADNGAPEGRAKDAPPPAVFAAGWQIGKPDLVLEMPFDFEVPASGTVEYQHILLQPNFSEDRWITAAEVRTAARSVMHHGVVFIRPKGSKWLPDLKAGEVYVPKRWQQSLSLYEETLDTYVPGAVPFQARAGQAKLLPAGAELVLQLHYTADGKAHKDRPKLGLRFAAEPPAQRIFSFQIASQRFTIPPGAPDYSAQAKTRLQTDVTVVGMMPHMHRRGKAMEYAAVYPDGRREVLLNVPNYDFNWQLFYNVAEQYALPKGTVIEVTATWDNSANNPRNPDATAEVKWGDQSWQEMLVGYLDVLIDPKLDPMDLFRARPKPGD